MNRSFNVWVKESDPDEGRITLAMTRKTLSSGGAGQLRLADIEFKASAEGDARPKLVGIKAVDDAPALLASNAEFPLGVTSNHWERRQVVTT